MKLLLLLLALSLATAIGAIDITEKDLETDDSLWSLYERWRSHHTISRDLNEKQKRFNVFKQNARYIHDFNKRKDAPYKLRLNKFADLTNQEFRSTYAGSRIDHHRTLRGSQRGGSDSFMYQSVDIHSLPASVDWRQKGAVTPVKDQGQCATAPLTWSRRIWRRRTVYGISTSAGGATTQSREILMRSISVSTCSKRTRVIFTTSTKRKTPHTSSASTSTPI